MNLKPGSTVQVKRGPLSGLSVVLRRRDNQNRAWYGFPESADGDRLQEIFVYDYELAETVERKGK